MDSLSVLLITYMRTECAVKTIRGLRDNLIYDPAFLHFHIADDGSTQDHINTLISEIGSFCPNNITHSNSKRQGVGVSMNLGQEVCYKHSDIILWLEDDWQLLKPWNPSAYLNLLKNHDDIGMIRLGYVSPGLKGELISDGEHLWWKLDKGPQYTFSGHAALRHRRFYQAYGPYKKGLTPGHTELYMCGTFNGLEGPAIVLPTYHVGQWGIFGHIGAESLKDTQPQ